MQNSAISIRSIPTCPIFIGIASFCILSLLFSCGHHLPRSDAYYDTLFAQIQKTAGNDQRYALVLQLDLTYRNTTDPSPYFQLIRHKAMSGYYYEHAELDKAKAILDTQIFIMERYNLKDKYPKEFANVLGARGNYFFNENMLDKAFDYYNRSKAIIVALKDNECLLSDQSYHLAMVAYRQEKYKDAAAYFKQSIQEMRGCPFYDSNSYYREQELYSNVGLSYSKAKMNDSAILFYKDALKLIDTEGIKYNYSDRFKRLTITAKGVIYGNMAKVYIASGEIDSAEHLLLSSIAINTQRGYENYDAMYSNMQLSELYYNTGEYGKALPILRNLRQALDTMANTEVNMRWYQLMYKMSRHFNRSDDAIGYLETYHRLKDSADIKLNTLKRSDYAGMLKDQETQYQIKLLKKDNQVNRQFLWLMLGIAGLSLAVVVLIYYNYRRSRNSVLLLTSLNHQVNEQKYQLEGAMAQLKCNNEDKDKILRIVAHDLRTPIGGIMTLSDFMVEEESEPAKLESLNMIMSASRNLMHLTNELLEFSGNRVFVTQVEKEETDINALAKQAATLLQFKANEKHQSIILELSSLQVVVCIMREKINRVLNNLITNAIKFSKIGGIITVTIEKKDRSILIIVKDNGIGIPERFIPVLFDPFTNAKRHGTQGERSFGLGLSICRQIMDEHGGRIWVESIEGEGSVFYIQLPVENESGT